MNKQTIVKWVLCLLMFIGATVTQAQSSERTAWEEASTDAGWPKMEAWLIEKGYIQGEFIMVEGLAVAMSDAYKCDINVCGVQFLELNGIYKEYDGKYPTYITVGHFKGIGQNGGWKIPASAISASSASATATGANPEPQPQVAVEDGVLKSLIEAMEYSKKELKGNKEALANVEAHLQNQLNEYKKTVDKKDVALGQQIIATELTIKSLGEQLAKIETRTSFLEETANLLGMRLSATEATVATVQGVQNAQGKRLSATESSVATLQTDQAKQGGRLTKVEESITDLTKEGGRLYLAEADVLNLNIAKNLQADLNVEVSDNLRYLGYAVVILFFGFTFLIFLLWLKVNSVGDKFKKFAQTEEELHDDNVAPATPEVPEAPVAAKVVAPATPAVAEAPVAAEVVAPATPEVPEAPVAAEVVAPATPVVAVPPPKGSKPEGIPTVQFAEQTAEQKGKQTATA